MKPLALLLIFLSGSVLGQPFTTENPSVGSTNCGICRISKVIVDKDYTRVLVEVDAQKKGNPWIQISKWTILIPYSSAALVSDLRNLDLEIPTPASTDPSYLAIWRDVADKRKASQNQFLEMGGHNLIRELEGLQLDTKYGIKSKDETQKFHFWMRFAPLSPGVEEILIMELIDGGFEWVRIKVRNPDMTPKTNWSEFTLKSEWEKSGLDLVEGIYESTTTYNNTKYRLALKKNAENYDLIYLSGASNPIWRTGDIKARVLRTASHNLFKSKWYMSDKTVNKDQYISFDKGVMKVTQSGGGEDQLFLKLYPTTSSDFSSGNSVLTSGTGFAISQDGYIATNHHVIQGKKIKVRGVKGDFSKTYEAKVVIEDRNNDLAIIKIEDSNFTTLGILPYKIDNNIADVGASVFALGYPLRATMGDEVKLTNGIISSKTGFQGDVTAYQISVPVQPGNSGGPLFDSKGNVVGIINAKHALAENASYAIKTNYLLTLIQSVKNKVAVPTSNMLANKVLSDQVKFVKEFVYIIETN
ncbi:trypsin-like peptidase domain-containing protein [Fulvivirga sp. 29W222]|uniref:Trypsin-like peptidase domain-containing protein n=1 Tax=Fulvivirga marina TaxID=2494733 RepID=A0A937G053_9BACT|nr:serine protease [Fulvivirga marina]MBL6448207.1 trypsin-like peptidase domain-containing protein [Fulvivirga marina]